MDALLRVMTAPVGMPVWLLVLWLVLAGAMFRQTHAAVREHKEASDVAGKTTLLTVTAHQTLQKNGLLDEWAANVEEELWFAEGKEADVTIDTDAIEIEIDSERDTIHG